MNYLLAMFSSCVSAFVLTWYVRRIAVGRKWVFKPNSDRHVHITPVPRLGGIAVFVAFCFTMLVLALASNFLPTHVGFATRTAMGLLGPATLVVAIGLYDDFRAASPYTKFAVEIAAACWLFLEGFRISSVPLLFGPRVLAPAVSLLLTVFWVLLITNAFNLIDGLDGLAAGSALFSTIVVFITALLGGNLFTSLCTAVLAGSVLGFLHFNFHPATIFLGDCGSLFIGFILSALALASSQKSPIMIAVAIPVLSFGLPMLETAMSVLRRFLNDKPLFTADREHIHHKLLARGFSQQRATMMLYGVSALFAAISLLLMNRSGKTIVLVLAVVGTAAWVALQRLGYPEMSELQRVAQRTIDQKRIIATNLGIRRAAERLGTCAHLHEVCNVLQDVFEHHEFDGFELKFPLPIDLAADPDALDWAKDAVAFRWAKPGNALDTCSWSLCLQLPSANSWKRGSLVLFRQDQRAPLRADVNLFTSVFQGALADALDRTVSRNRTALASAVRSRVPATAS